MSASAEELFASKRFKFKYTTATNIVKVFSVFNCIYDKSVLKYGNEKNYKKIKANIVFRLIVFVGNVSASVIHSRKVHLVAKCTKQMS